VGNIDTVARVAADGPALPAGRLGPEVDPSTGGAARLAAAVRKSLAQSEHGRELTAGRKKAPRFRGTLCVEVCEEEFSYSLGHGRLLCRRNRVADHFILAINRKLIAEQSQMSLALCGLANGDKR